MDVIANMLSRINNGQLRKLLNVEIPHSTFKYNILQVMLNEGYIKSCDIKEKGNGIKTISIDLKYLKDGSPVIQEMKKVSKPGRRIYKSIDQLGSHYNNLGTIILSTSKGVMSDADARKASLGGEVICKVF